jgi:thymidylate synthase (FAD)
LREKENVKRWRKKSDSPNGSYELRKFLLKTDQLESPGLTVVLEAITPEAEQLIERACRTCYLSFHRYNPPESTAELIQKVIRKQHHSVLEHAVATFRVKGASRVLTHELVRHRFISPSQESQRYVCYADKPGRKKTRDFNVVTPPTFKYGARDFSEKYLEAVQRCYDLYEEMLDAGIPPEDARYILPNGTTSEIVITANFRELRHFIWVRTNQRAHWEIRQLAIAILKIMKERAPIVFWDFQIDEQNMTATGEVQS